MAGKLRAAMWSMKHDRELILLAKTNRLDAIADHLQRSPAYILKRAARLGLSIKGVKAKGK
jgi:predicted transcriptional regulator